MTKVLEIGVTEPKRFTLHQLKDLSNATSDQIMDQYQKAILLTGAEGVSPNDLAMMLSSAVVTFVRSVFPPIGADECEQVIARVMSGARSEQREPANVVEANGFLCTLFWQDSPPAFIIKTRSSNIIVTPEMATDKVRFNALRDELTDADFPGISTCFTTIDACELTPNMRDQLLKWTA